MILTDREIKIAIARGQIVIDPPPTENKAFSSTALDLTLDPTITIFNALQKGIETSIDPTIPDFDSDEAIRALSHNEQIPTGGMLLQPGILILAWTVEYVRLPIESKIAARVEGKSSLARIGLMVHLTAPTIHAGFPGRIRLEMINHGAVPIRIKAGMRICQLIFETTLGTPEKAYTGQFDEQAPEPEKK